jgi:protein-L-isoaspartate(D-aspartate) O-methyltransferase
LKDTTKHQGLRKKLVDELIEEGIESKKVLDAIYAVPRHFFLDSSFEHLAYQNKAFPIGSDQTISQPFTVAFQTELLNIQKGDKILEIGTGSGYQSAILFKMGAKVFSIERHQTLIRKSKLLHQKLNIRINNLFGDGFMGWPSEAPFDKIIVTCGAPYIPDELIKQLKVGGVLVIPVGDDVQKMKCVIKKEEDKLETIDFGDFKFVPMLKNRARKV